MPAIDNIIQGHCPECGAGKNAEIVGEHRHRSEDDEHSIWWSVDHRILKCRGCDTIYFQRAEAFSESYTHYYDANGEIQLRYDISYSYWPSPMKRSRPSWLNELEALDTDLHSILNEVYSGLDNDLAIISAIGMRTAFDRATELLGVDSAKTFREKLDDLLAMGKIGVAEKTTLEVLADAGGAAAHRGWKPKPKQLETMMDIVEAFCYRNFILDSQVGKLKPQIPEKPKRRAVEKK